MQFPVGSWKGTLAIIPLTYAIALPTQAQTIVPANDGTGTMVTPNGQRLDIDGGQLSSDGNNLFHSFQEFGLDAGQTANFLSTPNIDNILGRVVGGNPSSINGLLQVSGSDANLFLINPAGIVFGAGASLNVAGDFTATSATGIGFDGGWLDALGQNNWAELVGDPNAFEFATLNPGAIVNEGNLAVGEGRNLSLFGGRVLNTGTLETDGGNLSVAAVAGESLVRLSAPGRVLSVEVLLPNQISGNAPIDPLSLPELLAGGSEVEGSSQILVNPDGSISLAGVGIKIDDRTGDAIVSGNLLARGNGADGSSSSIQVLGNRVGLFSATLDASGSNGGGKIFVGGDLQGGGTLPTAQQTFIDASSVLNVDALEQGNGGNAIVWSDQTTQFYGSISARGGPGHRRY